MAFSDGVADFRSDTVTRPTAAMRKAIAAAEVGDDVFGDDPEVNRLQDEAAEMVGMEAALFVASGTMANQVGVALHTRPGDQVLMAAGAHVRQWEGSGVQANSGVAVREVTAPEGAIDLAELGSFLGSRPDPHVGPYSLLTLENTFNGNLVALDHMAAAIDLARDAGAAVHLDGARLFNAALAADAMPAEVAKGVDSVSFCFSKGLGAPVGSVICGSTEHIARALWVRKRLGGGMRQVGILAAAARMALADWRRLQEDHELARFLAAGLRQHLGDAVGTRIDSNMVFISEAGMNYSVARLQEAWSGAGIKTGLISRDTIRLVCHRDVDKADADRLIGVVAGLGS